MKTVFIVILLTAQLAATAATPLESMLDLVSAASGRTVSLSGRATAGDGGGGMFSIITDDGRATNAGTVFRSTVNTNLLFVRQYSDALHVRWFGAVGNGYADDTTAIKAALAVCGIGGKVLLGSGSYLISDTLQITHGMTLEGDALEVPALIVAAGMSTSKDVIEIVGAAANDTYGITLENFMIRPDSGYPARYGVHLNSTAAGAVTAQFRMRNVDIRSLGGRPFYHSNPLPNNDAFYCSSFKECNFRGGLQGGLYFENSGDSVLLDDCKIYGPGVGIYMDTIPGAASCVISSCNITSDGEAIQFIRGRGLVIRDCNIEGITAATPPAGNTNLVNIIGDNTSSPTSIFIYGNSIRSSTGMFTNLVNVGDAIGVQIWGNELYSSTTGGYGVNITADAVSTYVGPNSYVLATAANEVLDAGTDSTIVSSTLGGLFATRDGALGLESAAGLGARASKNGQRLLLGSSSAAKGSWLQSLTAASGTVTNLILQPNGGWVAIGKTPTTALDIAGTATSYNVSAATNVSAGSNIVAGGWLTGKKLSLAAPDNAEMAKLAYKDAVDSFNLTLRQEVTAGNVAWVFGMTNNGTGYSDVARFDSGRLSATKFGVSIATDPLSPANGDIWYNSTTHKYMGWADGALFEFNDPDFDVSNITQANIGTTQISGTNFVNTVVVTNYILVPAVRLSRRTDYTHVAAATPVELDLSTNTIQKLVVVDDLELTLANHVAGATYDLRMTNSTASAVTITLADIVWESFWPGSLAAGKVGRIYLECDPDAATTVYGSFAEQP